MNEAVTFAVFTAAALLGLLIACGTLLRAWNGWLDLKRLELGLAKPVSRPAGPAVARIELAALKERVRKLEAIADGIDP
jgi:hypothetical protein